MSGCFSLHLLTLEPYSPPVTSPFFVQNSQAELGKPPKHLHHHSISQCPLIGRDPSQLVKAKTLTQLSHKAPFYHFRPLGVPDYLSDEPFDASTLPLLPQRLTHHHIHHSRSVDLQQRSPGRSYFHCGCTSCQIWLQLPQRPVGIRICTR